MDFRIHNTKDYERIAFSFKIPIIKRTLRLSALLYAQPEAFTYGIGSSCGDGKHIRMFDWDGVFQESIEQEIKFKIEDEHLSSFALFSSGRPDGFHAYNLDKDAFMVVYRSLADSTIDRNYARYPINTKGHEWVLRCARKGERNRPYFLKWIHSPYDERQVSTSHKKFLEKWYGIKEFPKYKNEDNHSNQLGITRYNTSNRIEKVD